MHSQHKTGTFIGTVPFCGLFQWITWVVFYTNTKRERYFVKFLLLRCHCHIKTNDARNPLILMYPHYVCWPLGEAFLWLLCTDTRRQKKTSGWRFGGSVDDSFARINKAPPFFIHTLSEIFKMTCGWASAEYFVMRSILCRVLQQPGPRNALHFHKIAHLAEAKPLFVLIATMEMFGQSLEEPKT